MCNVEKLDKMYITKQEFCEICGISPSTGYKLIKNQKIHFEKCRDGLLHYYRIPMAEALDYIEKRKQPFTDETISKVGEYYRIKLRPYPDAMSSYDIRAVTGYGKEAVRKWIKSDKLIGAISRKRFIVAKEDLIDFIISPAYMQITRKSEVHILDFKKLGII